MPVQSNGKPESRRRRLVGLNPLTLGAIVLALLVSLAAGARDRLGGTMRTEDQKSVELLREPSAGADRGSSAQAQSTQSRIDTEVISITPLGLEPNEITRPRGPFFLRINNRSGLKEFSLSLAKVAGQKLVDAPFKNGRLNWSMALDLPPGDYLISEADRPEWTCRLTVTPQ